MSRFFDRRTSPEPKNRIRDCGNRCYDTESPCHTYVAHGTRPPNLSNNMELAAGAVASKAGLKPVRGAGRESPQCFLA
jgi:hypothetical protein